MDRLVTSGTAVDGPMTSGTAVGRLVMSGGQWTVW